MFSEDVVISTLKAGSSLITCCEWMPAVELPMMQPSRLPTTTNYVVNLSNRTVCGLSAISMNVSLPVFCAVFFAGDLFNPLHAELFPRRAGWITGLAEKPVQSRRGYNPEQKQFVLRILKCVPGIPGDENGC